MPGTLYRYTPGNPCCATSICGNCASIRNFTVTISGFVKQVGGQCFFTEFNGTWELSSIGVCVWHFVLNATDAIGLGAIPLSGGLVQWRLTVGSNASSPSSSVVWSVTLPFDECPSGPFQFLSSANVPSHCTVPSTVTVAPVA